MCFMSLPFLSDVYLGFEADWDVPRYLLSSAYSVLLLHEVTFLYWLVIVVGEVKGDFHGISLIRAHCRQS